MPGFTKLIKRTIGNALRGELYTDRFSRGQYATDASSYQVMPKAVVVAAHQQDVETTMGFAHQHGVAVLPRGGGTSQCGQTVNDAIVIDSSKYLNRVLELDLEAAECVVEPGLVLDQLNQILKPHGLWFPVDVSTASRATIGGMAANNSCGSRSIRYGLMRDYVVAIQALLADGTRHILTTPEQPSTLPFAAELTALGAREAAEIEARFPKVMRRVGGYNIDTLVPEARNPNLAHLLVGSEGTLAWSCQLRLKLVPLPPHKLLGVCHFPSFHAAMEATQHIVKLAPVAVELIDRTMLDLARPIAMYRDIVARFVNGEPAALLLVEFAEPEHAENRRRLTALTELMGDLGFHFTNQPAHRGGVVEISDPALQQKVFEVRSAGLNIVMSMRDDRKPVSFVEDCAVALPDLAEYTARLTAIFEKHGTTGTWYAHASVGCLHVRPLLNLRLEQDIRAMRAIAEECFAMVQEYKGSHSGEHGDGICRSEFHEKMFGRRMVDNFRAVKNLFDPNGIMNPGRVVDPPKMDDARLFRYPPGYRVAELPVALNWRGYSGAGGGFQGAVEMCNNNGACRKLTGGVMCPSYRVTRDERHLTRGRANTLRLALSGQLGANALASAQMADTMSLCVGCKACRRECPTGVDMARMKIEVNAARYRARGTDVHHWLVANLPRYAPWLSRLPWLANLPNHSALLRHALAPLTGFCAAHKLPRWHRPRQDWPEVPGPNPVLLFADTFNTYFEPDNLNAARRVLAACGFNAFTPRGTNRPLCCGRTWLTCGMVDRARAEARRLLDAIEPFLRDGIPIVGLEPSCLLTLQDEYSVLLDHPAMALLQQNTMLFDAFLERHGAAMELHPLPRQAHLQGHCHQKAFDQIGGVQRVLERVPGLQVTPIESSCCGMAGAFGYGRQTADIARKMAELSLLPALRATAPDDLIIADGTSCRHQIELLTGKPALHSVQIIALAVQKTEVRF